MRFSKLMLGGLIALLGMVGCGGGGIEAGMPADVPQGVAPTFDTKPISAKDMPKNKNTGPMVPIPGKK